MRGSRGGGEPANRHLIQLSSFGLLRESDFKRDLDEKPDCFGAVARARASLSPASSRHVMALFIFLIK